MQASAILQPVIALGLWTAIIMVWMFIVRIRSANATKFDIQDALHAKSVTWPSDVARVGENYDHLFEQPTLFYAIALTIAVMGHGDQTAVNAAWAFVIFRVLHSLVQIMSTNVSLRLGVFWLSWAALLVLIIREAMMIF
ncbi:MAG: MAPEG family protein [Parvibaculales bacterium]